MAQFLRFICTFSALLCVVLNVAAFPASEQWYVNHYGSSGNYGEQGPFGSAPSACDAWFADYETEMKKLGRTATNGGFVSNMCRASNSSGGGAVATPSKRNACPANSNSDGSGGCMCVTNYQEKDGQCVKKPPSCPEGQHMDGAVCVPDKCPDGQVLSGGVCIPDPDKCPDGSTKVDGKCPDNKCKKGDGKNLTVTGNMPTAFCYAGCTYSSGPPPFPMVCVGGGAAGGGYCVTTYYGTGDACNGGPTFPSGGNTGGGDGGGGNTGGGNTGGGNTGGGNTGGGNTGGGNTGGGNTGGGNTGGGNTGGGNTGGGKDNESIPGTDPATDGKCPPGTYKSGGKCYPNENVTTDPDGTGKCPSGYTKQGNLCVGNKPLGDDDKGKDFCKENPTLDSCKSGSFQGSCKANFKCEGDAVQCAMATEQHKRNCELFEKDTDASSPLNKALNGTDEQSADKLKEKADQVDVPSSLDQGGLGWGSGCPQDPEISLPFAGGRSFSIPFSRICGPLNILALAGVGITLLGCAIWVVGGKKS